MSVRSPLFEGLSSSEEADLVSRLERRWYPAGATLVTEGEQPDELYMLTSGSAQVLVSEHSPLEQHDRWIGPGSVVGEVSVLTGRPAGATVKAVSDLEVLVMSQADFAQAGSDFPQLLRNVGKLLIDRLGRVGRSLPKRPRRHIAVLAACGAPPLVGYALACSLAWHTRRSTLLIAVGEEFPQDLQSLAERWGISEPTPLGKMSGISPGHGVRGARLMLAEPADRFSINDLPAALDEFGATYDHILVQLAAEPPEGLARSLSAPLVRLVDAQELGTPVQSAHKYVLRAWSPNAAPAATMPDQRREVNVPGLTEQDRLALQQGLLPSLTPAGKSLGWISRDLAGLKVGLALGAGSEKGYAHLGVLRVLQRVGIQPDFVAGTSIGSGVAALLALGRNLEQIREVVDQVGAAAFRPTLARAGFLSSAGLRKGLRASYGEVHFEELLLPLAVIAADLVSGREVVFEQGLLWPALLASMSIPGVFPAVCMGRFALVDGGIVNPVPSNVVAGLGADVVIAVKLATPAAIPVIGAPAHEGKGRPPSVFQAIPRSIEMMQSKIFSEAASAATILIEPLFTSTSVVGLGLRRFTRGQAYEELGEQAAEAALSSIAGALPWVRR